MEDKAFSQWVADNVDHNQATFTGKGTFHGIGFISASTFQMIKDAPVQGLTEARKASFLLEKGNSNFAIPWKKP